MTVSEVRNVTCILLKVKTCHRLEIYIDLKVLSLESSRTSKFIILTSMQLIILGKNSDDKGTQLETLTASILIKQGYTSVCTNVVNAGASEVDITANFNQPSMGDLIVHEVIGECKSYSKPITLPEWLKFLGKIFSEEISGKKVQGCFIALSGVNGNVVGHYNTIKTNRPDIVLLSGEALLSVLKKHFELRPIEEILIIIRNLTQKQPVNSAVCYYNEKFYWRVSFTENSYTLLNNLGEVIATEEAAKLHEYIIKDSDLLTFINLKAEKEAYERAFALKKFIVSVLLIEDTAINDNQLLNLCIAKFGSYLSNITLAEVQDALTELINAFILSKRKNLYELKMFTEDADLEDTVNFYHFFLYKTFVLPGLMSKSYSKQINENLFNHIIDIQGGVSIPEEKYQDCLQILIWSPTALDWSLNPDPNIVNHRSNGSAIDPMFEKFDTDYFIKKLYDLISDDFRKSYMSNYFFVNCGLIEVDTASIIIIKNEGGTQITDQTRERLGLVKMGEEYNNQVVIIRML